MCSLQITTCWAPHVAIASAACQAPGRSHSPAATEQACSIPSIPSAVYSIVNFGGVRNYLVATWTQADLEACADLNLPCADVSALLAEPLDNAPNGDNGSLSPHDQLVSLPAILPSYHGINYRNCWPSVKQPACRHGAGCCLLLSIHVCLPIVFHRQVVRWLRPTLVAHLLRQGFVTLYSGKHQRSLCCRGFQVPGGRRRVCNCNKAVTVPMNDSPGTLIFLSLPLQILTWLIP